MRFTTVLRGLALSLLFAVFFSNAKAGQGDTIVVQVFKFGHAQDTTIQFPADSLQFEKILMYYTLKCVPGNNPSCGEWDYLTYTFLYDSTGVLDSTLLTHPNFLVGVQSWDSVKYTMNPRYTYYQSEQYETVEDSVINDTVATLGAGAQTLSHPLYAIEPDARSQYLWTASELSNAGLSAGMIDAFEINIDTCGSDVKWMRIKMALTPLNSLGPTSYVQQGNLTTVYEHDISCAPSGFNRIYLNQPFYWDGTSNVVVDVSFDNDAPGQSWMLRGDTTTFNSGIITSGEDYFLDYEGSDWVELPVNNINSIDSAVTIMFWQYGDPNIQPQSDYPFEARNASGQRVISSHLPWGNGTVYWDCGNTGGSYDRINKAANTNDYAGQWNHWAFTKDSKTGEMYMYLNGEVWHSGTGLTRDMTGISRFVIGANALNLGNNYDGYIDDFSVWNVALDSNVIKSTYHSDITAQHPNYANLLAYYQFDEGNGLTTTDASPNSDVGTLMGLPNWMQASGQNMVKNFTTTNERPQVRFVQGTFVTHIDTTIVLDSVMDQQLSITLFEDSLNATTATDTIYAWQAASYAYTYDMMGNLIDSTWIGEDTTRYQVLWPYWGTPFEIVDRYELLRYITPYGIGLDLGDGWMWKYDMTDYRPLFTGKKRMTGGNWQELLDLKLVFIEGTPPRESKDVEVLWRGNHGLSNFSNLIDDKKVLLDSNASEFLVKSRASGHGFSNPTNCAEFCQKNHYLEVNGFQIDTWKIIIECAENPLYPQGGTWIFDRAAWCPGMETYTRNTEITGLVNPGDSVTIDYDADSDPYGNYVFEGQLISYGDKNFTLDAAITDIVSPNDWEGYFRDNPICNNPKIKIRNNGSTQLTTLDITYGPQGGNQNTYSWTGSLSFMEEEVVDLPPFNWGSWTGPNVWEVEIDNPNGGTDEYAPNNVYRSTFESTPVFPADFYMQWRTNGKANETKWTLKDDQGNKLYEVSPFIGPNMIYYDTFHLANGCYTLQLTDTDDDGLSFFANNDGTGFARLRNMSTSLFHTFEPNFGDEVSVRFTVGYTLGATEEITFEELIDVYPNPTKGEFTLDMSIPGADEAVVEIFDAVGRQVYGEKIALYGGNRQLPLSLSGREAGIYFVRINFDGRSETKRIVVNK